MQTFEGDTAVLLLPKPKPKEAGEYKCVVINPSGEDFCTAKITVQGLLSIMYQFHSVCIAK